MKQLLAVIVVIGLMWAYLYFSDPKSGALMIDDRCQVLGVLNTMRESVQGEKFWRDRMNVVEKQIAYEINEPKRLAYLRGLAEKKRNDEILEMNRRCESLPRFCLSPEELRSFQLRSESERLAMKADEFERKKFSEEMIDKLLVVRGCVREKLNN